MPAQAKRGEVIEIRTMVQHPMESGFRLDNTGRPISRHIVESFTCVYNRREIARMHLYPSVSTNPYFSFFIVANESGDLVFTWTDDQGGVATITTHL